jgi:hypothetical protein
MKISGRRFSVILATLSLTAVMVSALAVYVVDDTSAQRDRWIGYFHGIGRARSNTSYDQVFATGIPSNDYNKENFIGFILGKLGNPVLNADNSNSAGISSQDKVGAAYIIQTMRGGNDYGAPTYSDVEDWKARIRNPSLLITWTIEPIGFENTGHMINYNNQHDVMRVTGDNTTWLRMNFVQGGVTKYVLKQRCANPIGALGGLDAAPADYSLTPQTTTSGSNRVVVESGANIPNIDYAVAKTGGAASSKPTNWQLARCKYGAGYAPASNYEQAAADNNSNAVATYNARGGSCTQITSGVGAVFSSSITALGTLSNETTGSDPIGSRICYMLAISPPNHTAAASVWRHGVPVCVVIAKLPKSQVLGGDLRTNGNANASRSARDVSGQSYTFGSWVEYGIFATGSVTGLASGSALAGPGQLNSDACQRASLSFALSQASCSATSTTIGNYESASLIPNIAASYPQTGSVISAASVSPDALLGSAGLYVGTRTGDLTVSASNLQPGKSIILKVSGTVVIEGDQINNPDNNGVRYTTAVQLPQLVIIANKIIINGAVRTVDAWLVANGTDGTIETCDTGSTTYQLSGAQRLTDAKCANDLTVNGPVMANHLWLRRTAGSTVGNTGQPAETFNLRADAYLWAKSQSSSAGRIQTVYTTELPPRL